MESTTNTMVNGSDLDNNNAAGGGGVVDVYGEDFATEDQLITPWTVSVARWSHIAQLHVLLDCFFCSYVLVL